MSNILVFEKLDPLYMVRVRSRKSIDVDEYWKVYLSELLK